VTGAPPATFGAPVSYGDGAGAGAGGGAVEGAPVETRALGFGGGLLRLAVTLIVGSWVPAGLGGTAGVDAATV